MGKTSKRRAEPSLESYELEAQQKKAKLEKLEKKAEEAATGSKKKAQLEIAQRHQVGPEPVQSQVQREGRDFVASRQVGKRAVRQAGSQPSRTLSGPAPAREGRLPGQARQTPPEAESTKTNYLLKEAARPSRNSRGTGRKKTHKGEQGWLPKPATLSVS